MLGMSLVLADEVALDGEDGEIPTTLDVVAPPEVFDIELNEGLDIELEPGEDVTVWCNATVRNPIDELSNIESVEAELESVDGDESFSTDCDYDDESSDEEGDVGCEFTLAHYTESGDLECTITAIDHVDQEGSNSTQEEVLELLAFGYSDEVIDFGALAWEESAEESRDLRNLGNTEFNINVDSDAGEGNDGAMSCELGHIDFEDMETGDESGDLNTLDSENPVEVLLNAEVGNEDTPEPEVDVYFGVTVPEGVEGTCSGSLLLEILAA